MHLASAKLIKKDVEILHPVYLGRFGGYEVDYEVSATLLKGFEGGKIHHTKLELLVFDSMQEYTCEDKQKTLFTKFIYLPAHGSWSHNQPGIHYTDKMMYFYIGDCEGKDLPLRISIKLDIKDSNSGHISWESYGLSFLILLFIILFIGLIALYGRTYYLEKYEEMPLLLLFLITVCYLFSLGFNFMYVWVYGMDGTSYKFILLFSKMFGCFGEVSLIGILILVCCGRFSSKEFLIEEEEFSFYLLMLFAEFVLNGVDIFRMEPMEQFDSYIRAEGAVLIAVRIVYSLVIHFHKPQTLNIKPSMKLMSILFISSPVLLTLAYCFSPYYCLNSLIFFLQAFSTLALILYLYKNLCRTETYILPLKPHKY